MKKFIQKSIVFISAVMISAFFFNCRDSYDDILPPPDDNGDYQLLSKYDSIRSYPGGGGIFIVYIEPTDDFGGIVNLSLEAESCLNAEMSKNYLTKYGLVAEITIKPDENAVVKDYSITLKAAHRGTVKKIQLIVNMYHWQTGCIETVNEKFFQFREWLEDKNPAYSSLFTDIPYIYMTYPEILIVEHHTLLFQNYEARLCFHVMIPPYDWSKILIRKRGSLIPEIAAMRDTEGVIKEIPVEDYPVFSGY